MGAQCSTTCSKSAHQRPTHSARPEQPSERPKPRSWLSDKQANEAQMRLNALNPPQKPTEIPINPPIQPQDFHTFQQTAVLSDEEDPVPKQPRGAVRNLLPSFEEAS